MNERLGGLHSARCVLVSVDMGPISELMAADRWDEAGRQLALDALSVEAAGDALRRDGHTRVARLGTRCTMELPFLRDRLAERYGMEVLVPLEAERELLHRAVFEELALGVFTDETRTAFVRVIRALAEQGATAVILGCTEFGLLLRPGDVELPLYDTARLHAKAAVDAAVAE